MNTCRLGTFGSWLALVLATLAVPAPVNADPLRSKGETSDEQRDETPQLVGTIALSDALSAALVASPELAAFSAEIRAQEARTVQAGLLPNPDLSVDLEDFATSGDPGAFERTETTLSLSQLIELGGKRAKRWRLANLEKDLAGWDYETARASVLADVTRAFVQALSVQERVVLAGELIGLADASVTTVTSQVRSGAVSALEADRARVALDRARLERVQLEHALSAARAELAATWGGKEVTFTDLRGDLETVTPPPGIETFLAGIDRNPDLARWASELDQRRAALALEESRRVPDVTLGVGARRFSEDDTTGAVLAFSIPLPLFDRNQGGIAEARHRVSKAQAEQATAETSVRSALTASYEELHAAYAEVVTLRDEIVPRARRVFQGTKDNHARGLFRYLEVLDAQRTLFELRSQYLQALAAYHGARADVERLSGTGIEPTTRRNS